MNLTQSLIGIPRIEWKKISQRNKDNMKGSSDMESNVQRILRFCGDSICNLIQDELVPMRYAVELVTILIDIRIIIMIIIYFLSIDVYILLLLCIFLIIFIMLLMEVNYIDLLFDKTVRGLCMNARIEFCPSIEFSHLSVKGHLLRFTIKYDKFIH